MLVDAAGAVTYDEVQGRGAVATCRRRAVVGGTVGTGVIGGAVPHQRVANVVLVDGIDVVVDRQVQRGGAVASCGVGAVVSGCVGRHRIE